MSFNTRVILSLVALVIALIVLWFVALAHVGNTTPTVVPVVQATSTVATSTGTPLFTSTSTPTPAAPVAISGPDLPTVTQNIVGSWQSTGDGNYSVKITANGKWTDTYSTSATSSASQTGAYTLFTSADPDPALAGAVTPGVVYVKLVEGKSTSFFGVVEADGNNLQLVYLDRGNTISFVKAQ